MILGGVKLLRVSTWEVLSYCPRCEKESSGDRGTFFIRLGVRPSGWGVAALRGWMSLGVHQLMFGGQPRRNTQLGAVTTEAASKKTKTWVRWMSPDTALRCAPGLLALLLAAVVVVGRHDPDSNQISKRAARRGC